MLQQCEGVVPYDGKPNIDNVIEYRKGDILVSNIRPYLKKTWIADRDGGCSPDVLVFRVADDNLVNSAFLGFCLKQDDFFDFMMSGKKGMKMPRGDKDAIPNYIVPVPPMVEQKKILVEVSSYEEKIAKEIAKAQKKFGDAFDEKQFRETNPRVLENQKKFDDLHARYSEAMNKMDLEMLKQIILDEEIVCPISGTRNWTDVRQFNLMFSTEMGASADNSMKIYLRPETAQGIFVNYLNVQKTGRMKIPFGIAQIGKAFRNEIVARQFIFRMREFEQMEMQFFIKPGTELDWFAKWKETRMKWHQNLGFGAENYRFHDHDKLAHYANAATDIEFHMPFGFKEVEGIHSRTNFDLSQHEKFSGKQIKYFDPEMNESYTPYVIETSIGVDRMFLSIMCHSYEEEKLENGETRTVLHLPAAIAPVKLAVFPLTKKDGLPEKAQEIMNDLKFHFNCKYEEKDQIGKRYRRQDAIGTPYCVTVDHQTLEDNTVTLRERDSMEQKRVNINELRGIIEDKVTITSLLKKLQ